MILIGGLDPTQALHTLGEARNGSFDPWAQQIGVFDMTALQWKDAYYSKADLYRSPDIVKESYQRKYVLLVHVFAPRVDSDHVEHQKF